MGLRREEYQGPDYPMVTRRPRSLLGTINIKGSRYRWRLCSLVRNCALRTECFETLSHNIFDHLMIDIVQIQVVKCSRIRITSGSYASSSENHSGCSMRANSHCFREKSYY
uniref:Uncharacterized protein n=1 Tax=Rhizophagus irregularis (strain DAOM 181602 / DAOM 197198 / MUCL 43194) TaxID=747089 RepID=U9UTY4_RHIID